MQQIVRNSNLNSKKAAVLVTGGAGYIGSHVVWELFEAGYSVIVLDNLSSLIQPKLPADIIFYQGKIEDSQLIKKICQDHHIEYVIHLAASVVVPDSIQYPLAYYQNNVSATRCLLEALSTTNARHFIFSSSAAVYGQPELSPVAEDAPLCPLNPYGRSKLMVEWMLEDLALVSSLKYVALRYFNVAGADPQLRCGQQSEYAAHLITLACKTALAQQPFLKVYGHDYETLDGTCIRDYIHVSDLAKAHLATLHYLQAGGESTVLNCGYGHGYSVREVINTFKNKLNINLPYRIEGRRAGDPAQVIADPRRIQAALRWQPQYDNLGEIIASSYQWELKKIAMRNV